MLGRKNGNPVERLIANALYRSRFGNRDIVVNDEAQITRHLLSVTFPLGQIKSIVDSFVVVGSNESYIETIETW